MTAPYRHKRLPSLGVVSEREVVDEFRQVERWGDSANARIESNSAALESKAQINEAVEFALPYWSTIVDPGTAEETSGLGSMPAFYDSVEGVLEWSITQTLDYDKPIIFKDDLGSAFGGLGVPSVSGLLPFVALIGTSAPIEEWDNLSTRTPLIIGGSSLSLDAGSQMIMRLPGGDPNATGYTLQLASDGETVVPVENPPPNFSVNDDSTTDGDDLTAFGNGNWFIFPEGVSSSVAQRLEVVVPSGTEAGTAYINASVGVENTSNRAAVFSIGIGLDLADPTEEYSVQYDVPAYFLGRLPITRLFPMSSALTSDVTLTVFLRMVSGDHANLDVSSNSPHDLDIRVNYGGGSTPTPTEDVSGYGGLTWSDGTGNPLSLTDGVWSNVVPGSGVSAMSPNRNALVTVAGMVRFTADIGDMTRVILHGTVYFDAPTGDTDDALELSFALGTLASTGTPIGNPMRFRLSEQSAAVGGYCATVSLSIHDSGANYTDTAHAYRLIVRSTRGHLTMNVRALYFRAEYE